MSRDEYDERVRRNYAERQQAEADARYEDFDIADAVKIADDVYDYAKIIERLPISADDLTKEGWKDITDSRSLLNNPKLRQYEKSGIQIKFEKATPGAAGFRGIDHYHIINPKATGNHDYHLDKFGRPVSRKSKHSHIVIGGK